MTAVLEDKEKFAAISRDIYDNIIAEDQDGMKSAAEAASSYLKIFLKEDGALPRIWEPEKVTRDDLDRSVTTDMPQMVIELEQRSPAAATVPFMATPQNLYIQADRILIQFARVQSRKLTKNVDELWTCRMDVRLLLSDQTIRDLAAELDATFIRLIRRLLIGLGATVPFSGSVQWRDEGGPVSYGGLQNMETLLGGLVESLPTKVHLLNNLTMTDIKKNVAQDIGFTFLADVFQKGWSDVDFLNRRWIVTIKKDLVVRGEIFTFSDRDYAGGYYELQPPTMRIKRDDWIVSFYAHMLCSAWIGNTSAIGIHKFAAG